jgi:hypothetical protein
VKLQKDVFSELAALCQPTVNKLQNYKERRFERFAALDDEEYFWYEHAALPKHERSGKPGKGAPTVGEEGAPAAEDDTADLVWLVKHVDGLEPADRDRLDEGGFSFYAICWPHGGSMIGFVSRTNPVATLKPGMRYFQYGDAMTAARRPDFALKEGADLVVGAEGTAILSPYSFDTLLGDVGVWTDQVKKDLATARTLLADSISLTSGAAEALQAEASRTRANAKRLRFLLDRLKAISLEAASLRSSLVRHGVDPDLLLDANGQFSFRREGVPLFFDAVEGRYFEDDLSGERRRADRYSTR